MAKVIQRKVAAKKVARKITRNVARAVESELGKVIADIAKHKGEATILSARKIPQCNRIPTGAFTLDFGLLGGVPEGHATMLYGLESCLDGNTVIPYKVYSRNGKLVNDKGGKLSRLYRRFHGENTGKHGDHLARRDVDFYVLSADSDNGIVRNGILDVVKTGVKPCFKLSVGKKQIVATADHKFMTPDGFKRLGDLAVGDLVYMHLATGRGRVKLPSRPTICVKNHPVWPDKVVNDSKTGKSYHYKRGPRSHAAFEAALNGLSYDDYVDRLNSGNLKGLSFIPEGKHIHHEDGNFLNDSPINLSMVDSREHGLIHAEDCSNNTKYVATAHPIDSIISVGRKMTYDIKCAWPNNNFVANKFVVHNSGKTYLALKIVAEFHRKYPDKHAVWIDAEQLFDSDWAEMLGCDLDRMQVARPDTGNEAVDLMDALMEPEEVGMIVLDSIAGCVPQAIAEKSAEDHTMGELARLMGIMCSKMLVSWSVNRKKKHYVTVILINQFRFKIGVMFGDNRTTPGGRQPNHTCSTKVEIKNLEERDKGKTDNLGNDVIARNVHNFKLTKTKHGVSIREGEFRVSIAPELNDGIPLGAFVNHKTVTAYAKKMGVLTGGGSGGFKFDGIRPKFRIIDDAADYLKDHPEALLKISQKLIAMQRIDKGLTPLPPDGYLLDWSFEDDED